jgi:hypothetical protein
MDTLVVDLPSVEESENARAYGEMIGQGAFRAVYHIPGSKWAYKFDRDDEEANFTDRSANAKEIKNYERYKDKLPANVAFPEMTRLENGAIAVEFVNGYVAAKSHSGYTNCVCPSHGLPDCWRNMVEPMDGLLDDLHGRNVMIETGGKRVYIVDIGEFGEFL